MSLSASSIQDIVTARKQRWVDFYDFHKPDSHLLLVRWMPDLGERPWPHPENMQERIEWAWKKYQLQLEQLEWLEDDTLPFLDIFTGTEIFAAAFGCQVYYPPSDMPFALPRIKTASEVASIEIPDLDAPAIATLFQIADELRSRAGSDALMHMVDLQTPMDIAALIWDKTQFYPAMIQEPEAVHALAEKVGIFQARFLDAWFARYSKEFIAHYPDYYMQQGITLSEDEIGAVSTKMFDKFFLPEITALSERYGGIGIHCCAHARHQWANLKKVPGLRMLNLNQPGPVLRDSVPYFAGTCAQYPIFPLDAPSWEFNEQFPTGARLVFDIGANSQQEAVEAVSRFRELKGGA